MELKNFHVFRVTYLPMTATLNTRFKVTSDRFKQSVLFNTDELDEKHKYIPTYLMKIAKKLEEKGFNIVGMGNGDHCNYIISDTLEPLNTV